MTWLAPGFLAAAGLIAGAVIAIHLIVTREPRVVRLPTARFAPARPVRARTRRLRLQDLLLLLLRVLVILAVGAGLARPVLDPPRRELARIILADNSRAVADPAEVADSVRSIFAEGDVVVLFDSATAVVRAAPWDTLAARGPARVPGRLSAALIAALQTATADRARADAFELTIISPLAAEAFDQATDSVRALWPGAIRHIPVALREPEPAPHQGIAFAGDAADPLRFALDRLRPAADTATAVRIVRGGLTAVDSAWAAGRGRVLVHWPAAHGADSAPPVTAPWRPRAVPDTIGGVGAGGEVVVAPFERRVEYDVASANSPAGGGAHRVVARWVDGAPAAVETPHGEGCIRSVAVGVPAAGDLVLQPRFRRLAARLAGPCDGAGAVAPADSARLTLLTGDGSAERYVAADELPAPESVRSTLAPWLFAAALVFALAALLLQRWVARRGVDLTAGGGA